MSLRRGKGYLYDMVTAGPFENGGSRVAAVAIVDGLAKVDGGSARAKTEREEKFPTALINKALQTELEKVVPRHSSSSR